MDIQTISITLAGIGIFIAALNSVISSRHAHRQRQTEIDTRQAELLMQLYDRWSSKDFRQDSLELHSSTEDEIVSKFGPDGDLDQRVKITTQATFYEGIGILVERGLIDIGLVDALMHNNILGNWERLQPVITLMRKRQLGFQELPMQKIQHPHYDSWERLYHRIKQISESSIAS